MQAHLDPLKAIGWGGWWCVVVGGAHKILVTSPEAKFLFPFKPSKCLLSISLIKIQRCSP